MNGHFSVVNKRGLITSGILLAASIILFSLSLSKKLAGGSIIWTIPLVVCIIIFILAIIIMTSVLTAGIDVKNGIVIFADATGQGGKQPQFNLGQLDRIELRNADGVIENPETDSLLGARFVFILSDGEEKIYYPVSLTSHQYKSVSSGIYELKEKADSN
ncbi:MAG: hypothetical protein ACI4LC_03030 [Emergencia sp.]